jgi:UDP-glucose:glycoprotein glucosyltransferase
MYPGQAPTVRRNMYNVVLVFDLARPSSLHFITHTLSMLIDHAYPVRFGIVPIVETEEGVMMAKVFYYMVQNYGRQKTMRFFDSIRGMCFGYCPRFYVMLDP